jgi:hypothetical protein
MEQARQALKKLNVFASMGAELNRRCNFADYGIRASTPLG